MDAALIACANPRCGRALRVRARGWPVHVTCPRCGTRFDYAPDGEVREREIPVPPVEPVKTAQRVQSGALARLHALIGLAAVKRELEQLAQLAHMEVKRRAYGLRCAPIAKHLVFTGNPGTGKTTVARLVGEIFHAHGLTRTAHVIETDRAGLVGEYVGHTAMKTRALIEAARGGVLFIDEAYTLANGAEEDFGREAIDTLVKCMEDWRDDLAVIVAGYPDDMARFIAMNHGLASRFATVIAFADYSAAELLAIFESVAAEADYRCDEAARQALAAHFAIAVARRTKGFGNGRVARNLFDKVRRAQAARLWGRSTIGRSELQSLTQADVRDALRAGAGDPVDDELPF